MEVPCLFPVLYTEAPFIPCQCDVNLELTTVIELLLQKYYFESLSAGPEAQSKDRRRAGKVAVLSGVQLPV